MSKYEDFLCPKCNQETLHRIRNRYGVKGGKNYQKYQARHCLVCNHYHGYRKDKIKGDKMVSLR